MNGWPYFLIRFAEEEPSSEPNLDILTDTLQEKEFEIMLYNDDVNTFFHVIETFEDKYHYAIVSDGAGSAENSHVGSKIACESLSSLTKKYLESSDEESINKLDNAKWYKIAFRLFEKTREELFSYSKDNNVDILPVDSEHSAIYQCLLGEKNKNIEKIILTASGGPFRGKSIEDLKYIKKEDALNHPNWDMGNKISIDSSTLMNKGLEVIEAKYLFNIDINSIEVVVHPQSIIHSMVEFNDGSIKAQMGEPDMKLPIQFALGYPERLRNNFKKFNFLKNNTLNFEKPCLKTFNNLKLAFEAGLRGGNSPCILNASNEVVVEAFLNEKINYLDMTKFIEDSLNKISYIATPNLEQLIETDLLTRSFINKKIKSL